MVDLNETARDLYNKFNLIMSSKLKVLDLPKRGATALESWFFW